MATNYLLVRLKQSSRVHFCRTYDHSTMAVATRKTTGHTHFHVPNLHSCRSLPLVVIANGIESKSVEVHARALPAPSETQSTGRSLPNVGPFSRASKCVRRTQCEQPHLYPLRPLSIRIESPIRTDYGSRKPSRRLDGSIPQNYLADFQLITAAPRKSCLKTHASGC